MCVTAPWVGLCVSLCLDPREHMGKPVVHPLGVCARVRTCAAVVSDWASACLYPGFGSQFAGGCLITWV